MNQLSIFLAYVSANYKSENDESYVTNLCGEDTPDIMGSW